MKNSEYSKEIDIVLNELDNFPLECKSNFCNNLETLEIVYDPSFRTLGNYNPSLNLITFRDRGALIHELFHMAFCNSGFYGKKVYGDLSLQNGISLQSGDYIFGYGLTEGFAEYLSRKCGFSLGRDFEYYFADLLISIYGEDILKYSLKNDPIGFLRDDRFKDIKRVISKLDELEDLFVTFKFIIKSAADFKDCLDKEDDDVISNFSSLVNSARCEIGDVIKGLFSVFIDEYKSFKNPCVSCEEFSSKIEAFCSDENYDIIFEMSLNDKLKEDVLDFRSKVTGKSTSK